MSREGGIWIVSVSNNIAVDGVRGINDWHEDTFERT